MECSGAGLWDLDVATGYIASDAHLLALMGLPHDSSASYDSTLGNIHAEDQERVAAAVAAALAGENGRRYLMEFRTVGPDHASLRWVESRAHVFFDAEGKAAHVARTRLDITARRQAEAAQQRLSVEVQRSEESFRTLAESLPDTVWTSDALGRVVWMNSVLPRTTGRPFAEILAEGPWILAHPDDVAPLRRRRGRRSRCDCRGAEFHASPPGGEE